MPLIIKKDNKMNKVERLIAECNELGLCSICYKINR